MDLDLNNWTFADFSEEEKEKEIEVIDFDYKAILEEVGIHEASHFVLGVLVLKLDLGFTPLIGLQINVTDELADGTTMGCYPPVGPHDFKGADDWFKYNRHRIIARFLSTIIGYVTYKSFFEDTDYFISFKPNLIQYTGKIFYYNLKTVLAQNDCSDRKLGARPTGRIVDYRIIHDYFKLLNIRDFDTKLEICEKAIKLVMELLEDDVIRKTIMHVKDILIKNNGLKIEGSELKTLVEEVDYLTKDVSLEPWIKRFENEILPN